MIKFWLSLSFIFLLQETASTSALIFQANQNHISFWTLLFAWLLMTTISIYVGYFLGKILRLKSKNTKFGTYIEKQANRLEKYIGARGESLVIIVITLINFVYINAFLCAWLTIGFKKMAFLMLLGNVISFIIIWEAVTHIQTAFSHTTTSLGIAITLVFVVFIGIKTTIQKLHQKP